VDAWGRDVDQIAAKLKRAATGMHVLGDRSIFVAGPDGSAPSRLAMDMVSADGDPSGFTFCCRAGVVTPNGDNWEGGSIEWNSSQAINPNLIIVGTVSHNPVLYAVDPCTGAGDANFNGDGFLSVPRSMAICTAIRSSAQSRVTAASSWRYSPAIR